MSPNTGKGNRHLSYWIDSGEGEGMGVEKLPGQRGATPHNATSMYSEYRQECLQQREYRILVHAHMWKLLNIRLMFFVVNAIKLHLPAFNNCITNWRLGAWNIQELPLLAASCRWILLSWLANPGNPSMSPHNKLEDLWAECSQLWEMGFMATDGHGPEKNCPNLTAPAVRFGSEKLWVLYLLWNLFCYWKYAIHESTMFFMRWSGMPHWEDVVAAKILKLWPENFSGMPAVCSVDCKNEDRWACKKGWPSW